MMPFSLRYIADTSEGRAVYNDFYTLLCIIFVNRRGFNIINTVYEVAENLQVIHTIAQILP